MNGNLYERLCSPVDGSLPFARQAGSGLIRYGALQARSAQYANALLDLGLAPGDRVLVQADKSVELIMLYLGA
ncbi:MAG: AMP-binding protein, partial [Proteobacteria bacterium]|nr:AMP-binding protein [Pseudomonadota bacterium]